MPARWSAQAPPPGVPGGASTVPRSRMPRLAQTLEQPGQVLVLMEGSILAAEQGGNEVGGEQQHRFSRTARGGEVTGAVLDPAEEDALTMRPAQDAPSHRTAAVALDGLLRDADRFLRERRIPREVGIDRRLHRAPCEVVAHVRERQHGDRGFVGKRQRVAGACRGARARRRWCRRAPPRSPPCRMPVIRPDRPRPGTRALARRSSRSRRPCAGRCGIAGGSRGEPAPGRRQAPSGSRAPSAARASSDISREYPAASAARIAVSRLRVPAWVNAYPREECQSAIAPMGSCAGNPCRS